MLTVKQEKFVQNLIKGMSQREAYKNSYDASKMKDETIDKRASELMQKGEIKGRYEELIKKTEDEAIMSAKERKKWLNDVIIGKIKQNKKQAKILDKIKAIDILNKMDGEYTSKVQIDNPKATKILSSINKQLGGKSE